MQACSNFRQLANNQESAVEAYGAELLGKYLLDLEHKLNGRHIVTKTKLRAAETEAKQVKCTLEREQQEHRETLDEWEGTEEQLKAANDQIVQLETRNQELVNANNTLEETIKTLRHSIGKAAQPPQGSPGGHKRQAAHSSRERRNGRGKPANNKSPKTHHHFEIKAPAPGGVATKPDKSVALSAGISSSGSTPEKRSVTWDSNVKFDSDLSLVSTTLPPYSHQVTAQAKSLPKEEQDGIFNQHPSDAPEAVVETTTFQQHHPVMNHPVNPNNPFQSTIPENPFASVMPPPGFPVDLTVQPPSSSPWDIAPSENHSEWNRMGFFGLDTVIESANTEQKPAPGSGSELV